MSLRQSTMTIFEQNRNLTLDPKYKKCFLFNSWSEQGHECYYILLFCYIFTRKCLYFRSYISFLYLYYIIYYIYVFILYLFFSEVKISIENSINTSKITSSHLIVYFINKNE